MNRSLRALFAFLVLLVVPTMGQEKQVGLEAQLKEVLEGRKAQVGVAVVINGEETITLNNDRHYPMMSVFKFHQALSVVDYLERNNLSLATLIPIRKSDLKPDTYSPLRDKYPQGVEGITVEELLLYTLQLSDNNACDILFDFIGGTAQTDRYIRSLGIVNFAISQTEDDMHRDLQLCYENWTTPLDAVHLLEIFTSRSIFRNAAFQSFIRRAMIECATGKDRLPKPLLETEVVVGHKTGTGDRNAHGQIIGTNDIGFVLLPDGRRYTIAVFVKDSEEDAEASARIIADISAVVYRYVLQNT